jgi:cystathionine gamma-lyase
MHSHMPAIIIRSNNIRMKKIKVKNNPHGTREFSFATNLIHAGEKPDPVTGAVAPVLVRSKTFRQPHFGVPGEWQYSRAKNPTRSSLEEKLAVLEGGGYATVFGSGNAATAMFLLTLNPGDHVLFCQEVYGGTFRIVTQFLNRWGLKFDFADFRTEKSIRQHIKENTKYIFVETPTNPSLHIIDLSLIQKVSRDTGIPFVVDSTFSPPCSTRPFEYGAEAVIHSLSKYCAGHNDVIAGAVITRNKELHNKLYFLQKAVGAILSPDECYRVLQGIKTLDLRWKRVSKTAQKVAEYLSRHPAVTRVAYPGLKTHPLHNVAQRQQKNGFGAVVSFELKTDDRKEIEQFVNAVVADGIIIYGESLASPETILAYPPLMSHGSLPKEERLSLGISDSFFRLSVGFEDPADIISCIDKGFMIICDKNNNVRK